jgi:hypothetical protein
MQKANLHDHLLTAEEGIADEFARAQRDGLLTVCHFDGYEEVIEPRVCLRYAIEAVAGKKSIDGGRGRLKSNRRRESLDILMR